MDRHRTTWAKLGGLRGQQLANGGDEGREGHNLLEIFSSKCVYEWAPWSKRSSLLFLDVFPGLGIDDNHIPRFDEKGDLHGHFIVQTGVFESSGDSLGRRIALDDREGHFDRQSDAYRSSCVA